MNDRIALLLPTRRRIASLHRVLESIVHTAARRADVVVVVGVDEDDEETLEFAGEYRSTIRVLWSVAPRELTLGRLWNRLSAADHGADVLAMLTDDYVMATPGWDDEYRHAVAGMPGGYGTAWPTDPLHIANFCTAPVITRRMMERMGFFVPPWFPFWFHDTWLEEIGAFIACRRPLAARIAAPDGRGVTQNMRELTFWARLFEATRRLRMQVAHGIIDEIYAGQHLRQVGLKSGMQAIAAFYATRMAPLLDPDRAALIEQRRGKVGEPGARYLAARREGEALLASLLGIAS